MEGNVGGADWVLLSAELQACSAHLEADRSVFSLRRQESENPVEPSGVPGGSGPVESGGKEGIRPIASRPGCCKLARHECRPPASFSEADRPPAVIVGVQLQGVSDEAFDSSLTELERLGETLGLRVIGRVTQKRQGLGTTTVVGEGKLKELAQYTGGPGFVPSYAPPGSRRRLGRGGR